MLRIGLTAIRRLRRDLGLVTGLGGQRIGPWCGWKGDRRGQLDGARPPPFPRRALAERADGAAVLAVYRVVEEGERFAGQQPSAADLARATFGASAAHVIPSVGPGKGLGLVDDIKNDLASTMLRTGRDSLSEIVGADAATITAEDWPVQ